MSATHEDDLPDVRHVVVLMLENRSFDNILGWAYSALRPPHFIPPGPLNRYNGLRGLDRDRWANPVTVGGKTVLLPPTRGFSTTTIGGVQYLMPPPVDPNETFVHMTRQIYGPWKPGQKDPPFGNLPPGTRPPMKGFAADYAGELGTAPTVGQIAKVMEAGTGDQVFPFHTLAYAYAVSDAWFGSCPTQTDPNRAFMACGTSEGKVDNSDLALENFTAPTVWCRLRENGVSWKIYWESPFPPDEGTMSWTRRSFAQIRDLDDSYFPRMSAFHRDARCGQLPFFTFLEPSWTLEKGQEGFQGNDLHPPGDIRPGLQFVSAVYTSLVSDPAAWAKTVLLITFDENGGTFDHVPPPDTATPDTRYRIGGFRFDRFGPRVPALLISPMVEAGTVFRSLKGLKTPYDHTSIPATVLKLAGIPKEKWKLFDRVEVAPTFEGVLTRAKNPRTDPRLGPGGGDWEERPEAAGTAAVSFGDPFLLRYASAGPFQNLYVTADDTNDGTALWLTGDRTKALPFRFTMGYSPDTARPAGMSVRAVAAVHVQFAAAWGADARNESYVRVKDTSTEVATWCYFGTDDQWWYSSWYVSHPSRAGLAWQVLWGDEVLIEYHALDGNTVWLPRKIVVRDDWAGDPYLAVGDDSTYDDTSAGRWVVERP